MYVNMPLAARIGKVALQKMRFYVFSVRPLLFKFICLSGAANAGKALKMPTTTTKKQNLHMHICIYMPKYTIHNHLQTLNE